MAALAAYRFWKHILLWRGVLLLLMARVPLLWSTGEFVSEDGWVFFADAFNAPWWESLVTPFAGYFRLEARLFAELLSPLPWAWQPYDYAMGGLSINAVILALFYAPGFRSVLPDDGHRILIVLLLAAAPNAENLGLVTGQHWYLAFGLALLLVMETPVHRAGRGMVVLGSSIAVWSSPSVLVLWPLLGYTAATARSGFGRIWKAAAFIQLTLAGLAVAVFRGTAGERSGEYSVADIPLAVEHLLVRGWVMVGLNGRWLSDVLADISPLILDVGGVFSMLILGWVTWGNRNEPSVRWAAILVGIGATFALASLWPNRLHR